MKKEKTIHVLEGLSIESESNRIKPYLIGSKCKICGRYFFPSRRICSYCYKEEVKEIELSKRGKLYSFTIIESEKAAPPGFKVPYAFGYIDLPEGVRVLSLLKDWKKESIQLDMDMELVIEKFFDDSEGNEVYGYKFRSIYQEQNK